MGDACRNCALRDPAALDRGQALVTGKPVFMPSTPKPRSCDGEWTDATIEGDVLNWRDGSSTTLELTDDGIAMLINGERHTGVATDAGLVWSDSVGKNIAVWKRMKMVMGWLVDDIPHAPKSVGSSDAVWFWKSL